MSAIFGPIGQHACPNCGASVEGDEPECVLCRKLGDRSLVRLLRLLPGASEGERRELLTRFHAAKGRSWNAAERAVMEGVE